MINFKSEKFRYWSIFAAGILWGIAITFILSIVYLRHSIIDERLCEGTFEQSVGNLRSAVSDQKGWTVEPVICALPNTSDNCRMRTFKLCNMTYAKAMLNESESRKVSSIVPCTFAIYEKPDGRTYIARLNVRIMGILLGGNGGRILPNDVNNDQEKILQKVISQ